MLLAILATLTGFLLSRASLLGKAGISLFYREYQFLKVWWQGALVVLAVWLLLLFQQGLIQTRTRSTTARAVHIAALIAAVIGLYFTYLDFRNTLTHRLLGERFHLGGYLFWVGWMLVSLYYLSGGGKVRNVPASEGVRKPEHT